MGHSVTLGGDRVGSGNKNKVYLHNYERSTHNMSEKFTSSLGVGMLVPFLVIPATRDDKFEIDLSAGLRTIPTKGPLFGSFKLQLDVYQCPNRLYQALLHNNPLAIGLKANQVKWPKMTLQTDINGTWCKDFEDIYIPLKAANNSLVRYLGIAGIGNAAHEDGEQTTIRERTLTALHMLAYYDIFKNYYANKQETNAYTLDTELRKIDETRSYIDFITSSGNPQITSVITEDDLGSKITITTTATEGDIVITGHFSRKITQYDFKKTNIKVIFGTNPTTERFASLENIELVNKQYDLYENNNFRIRFQRWEKIGNVNTPVTAVKLYTTPIFQNEVILKDFPLKNIDDARMSILSHHQLGESFNITTQLNYAPYNTNFAIDNATGAGGWQKALTGLCVKTYQSDLYNNWIKTAWVDGENGIAAITAISTGAGSITIDAINFSEKLYNLLNRIAVSGNTYEDYLDAAYTDSDKKFCEAPIWVGGMSDEIVFEEIVQTAPTDNSALGTLGGRGNLLGRKKGGKITIKVDEPSFIIGIVSITPRIQYTQGLEWYNTELDSLQDIHVPALDGIAFQNLLAQQMHFASDYIGEGDTEPAERRVIGKVPAWINYMTSVDKAYGDFAAEDGDGYMILNRNYEFDAEDGILIDATTYIDPAKYNYAFAYTKRDAQNFWVQIHSDIKARRLMSAKQIPNV